jgi:hypothetical protein
MHRLVIAGSAAALVAVMGALGHPSVSSTAAALGGILVGDEHGGFGEADGVVPEHTSARDTETPGVGKLDPRLLEALRRAAEDAAEDGVVLEVNSGWRSAEYQEHLRQEAVSEHDSEEEAARWVATPETSAHVSGDAVDVGPAEATQWLSEHGAAHGLCQIYLNEPWHYELRPGAVDDGCPAAYADPTHDPRMWE